MPIPPTNNIRKPCLFCTEKISFIDYKDTQFMRRFMSPHAKIMASKKTGTCRKHQRMVSTALKRARHMALLPFVST
ncbi:MAG TPA: 30S ribosomal protein S18 [Methylomirabilota bacterium]|jgi:ribosomal protein S18|nr:30S ribosomal protein S18 [Methylomirabilota bacterium]